MVIYSDNSENTIICEYTFLFWFVKRGLWLLRNSGISIWKGMHFICNKGAIQNSYIKSICFKLYLHII